MIGDRPTVGPYFIDHIFEAVAYVIAESGSSSFLRFDVSPRAMQDGLAVEEFVNRLIIPVLERLEQRT